MDSRLPKKLATCFRRDLLKLFAEFFLRVPFSIRIRK
jgi:hypothetical protein